MLYLIALLIIYRRHYDVGRFLIYFTGMSQVFISADIAGPHGGYDFFYTIAVTIPFVCFALEERWKGYFMSILALIVMILQEVLGPGLFWEVQEALALDRIVRILIVMSFMIVVMAVSRWQMALAQEDIKQQQAELIHSANLISLGEMSGGIAHEINNPLQILSLQNAPLKRYLL